MNSNQQDSLEHMFCSKPQEDKLETSKLTLKERKAARRARQLIGMNKGRWFNQEKREYYVFLKIYSQFFVTKDHRRNDKVFRMMADFVKTRTPDQCRTHHQKLQFKFFKLSKILEALKAEFGSIDYDEIVKKCQTVSTNINTPTTNQQRDAGFDQCQQGLFVQEFQEMNKEYNFQFKLISEQSPKNSIINQMDDDDLNFFKPDPQFDIFLEI